MDTSELEDHNYWELRSYPVGGRLKENEPYELVVYGVGNFTGETIKEVWLKFKLGVSYEG